MRCYLASGTDEPYVLDEAAALQVTPYFAGIYGAQDDYKAFSKKLLIDRIIAEHTLSGPEFVAFGDGFVEIEDTVRVGGIGVGVATNEAERAGIDEWKRTRLIQAGADVIVPDFREHAALVAYLFASRRALCVVRDRVGAHRHRRRPAHRRSRITHHAIRIHGAIPCLTPSSTVPAST